MGERYNGMLNLQYVGEKIKYPVNFKKISKHIVQITGEFPIRLSGFTLSRLIEDNWKPDYSGFNTVYREIEGGVLFSDDGSVYVAPPEPEPGLEPEPYIPTLDEIKEMKKHEIYNAYQAAKAVGVDIKISTGVERFPMSDENMTFLIGKQMEVTSGDKEFISYQDAQEHCKFYSREDMQIIINSAFAFVDFQTTYRNNLCEWVSKCQSSQEVEKIFYGAEIPEEQQNEVYKSHLAQLKEDTSENI